MKTHKILTFVTAVVSILPTFAFATVNEPVVDNKMAVTDAMPIYNPKKYYKFDAKAALQAFTNKTSSLQEITCPSDVLMRQAGLVGTNRKWTNVTYQDTDTNMYISYDLVYCNFNGYTINADYNNLKPISEETAITTAKTFLASSFIKDLLGDKIGEPIVTSKYSNGSPMPIDARISSAPSMPVSPDYIDKDEFTNITVMFPYVVNGQKVYSNYGGRMGVTVEVTDKGVMSYNGQMLTLSDNKKDAKPMTNLEFINYIKRGGNSPYYGTKSTVVLSAPERVYTIVNDWRNNKSTNYLATATLFSSSTSLDEYQPWNKYEMVITDYKFANTNMTVYPQPMY